MNKKTSRGLLRPISLSAVLAGTLLAPSGPALAADPMAYTGGFDMRAMYPRAFAAPHAYPGLTAPDTFMSNHASFASADAWSISPDVQISFVGPGEYDAVCGAGAWLLPRDVCHGAMGASEALTWTVAGAEGGFQKTAHPANRVLDAYRELGITLTETEPSTAPEYPMSPDTWIATYLTEGDARWRTNYTPADPATMARHLQGHSTPWFAQFEIPQDLAGRGRSGNLDPWPRSARKIGAPGSVNAILSPDSPPPAPGQMCPGPNGGIPLDPAWCIWAMGGSDLAGNHDETYQSQSERLLKTYWDIREVREALERESIPSKGEYQARILAEIILFGPIEAARVVAEIPHRAAAALVKGKHAALESAKRVQTKAERWNRDQHDSQRLNTIRDSQTERMQEVEDHMIQKVIETHQGETFDAPAEHNPERLEEIGRTS